MSILLILAVFVTLVIFIQIRRRFTISGLIRTLIKDAGFSSHGFL